MVEKQDAIVDYGDVGWHDYAAIRAKPGCRVDDVVGLPFSGLLTRVRQGDVLLINGARLTVDVGLVLIVIQNLYFVAFLKEYAAVAATLTYLGRIGDCRRAPFDMELYITERLFGPNVACSGSHRDRAVFDSPLGSATVDGDPIAEVAPVEQNDSIRRCIGRRSTRRDDLRLRFPYLS